MMQHYQKEIVVNQFECDFQNRMKLSAILRQVEQVSMENCNAIGVDAAMYERTHTAFLLGKLTVEVSGGLTVGDRVLLDTSAALPIRAVYHRYTGLSRGGKEVAGVDTRWMLVDTQTRRILRRPPEEFHLPFLEQPERELDLALEKMDAGEPAGEVRAEYSRVDVNRHLNNAEYADVVLNALPDGCLTAGRVRKLTIYYHNELPMGGTMRLFRQTAKDGFLFRGIRLSDEKLCFEARLWMAGALESEGEA